MIHTTNNLLVLSWFNKTNNYGYHAKLVYTYTITINKWIPEGTLDQPLERFIQDPPLPKT